MKKVLLITMAIVLLAAGGFWGWRNYGSDAKGVTSPDLGGTEQSESGNKKTLVSGGGIRVALKVPESDQANGTYEAMEVVKESLKKLGYSGSNIYQEANRIVIDIPGKGQEQVRILMNSLAPMNFQLLSADNLPPDSYQVLQKNNVGKSSGLRVSLDVMEWEGAKQPQLSEIIKVLRARVKQLGDKGVLVYQIGQDQIIVDMLSSSSSDPEAQIDRLINPGHLEILDEAGNTLVTNSINSVYTRQESNGDHSIAIEFNRKGSNDLARATEANIGKPLAISLDDRIISAPVVNEAIKDGICVINGNFSVQEARDWVDVLSLSRYPLPGKLKIMSKVTFSSAAGALGGK